MLREWRVDSGHGVWRESLTGKSRMRRPGLLRGEGLKSEMKSKILGLGLGLTLVDARRGGGPACGGLCRRATPTTCYTGCTTVDHEPAAHDSDAASDRAGAEPKLAVSAGSASLPFTGADIEEMAAVGAGALLVGGLMVRRSRRVRRAAA